MHPHSQATCKELGFRFLKVLINPQKKETDENFNGESLSLKSFDFT